MPNTREDRMINAGRGISDSRRDAERYYKLLLALDQAAAQIKEMEHASQPDIDAVLGRLLPDLLGALNGREALVALVEDHPDGAKSLRLTEVYPNEALRGQLIPMSPLFEALIADESPRVITPLGDEDGRMIRGLELFGATAAILGCTHGISDRRVVAVCNYSNSDLGPYLSADGRALDNIIELVAIGARIGERKSAELLRRNQHWQAVHEASKAISAGFTVDPDCVLDRIVEQAVLHISTISGPRAVSGILQLYDAPRQELEFRAVYPAELWPVLKMKAGEKRTLERRLAPDGKIGITGRAVLERKPQRVGQIVADSDYILINPQTKSELAVPLMESGYVIGVLSLESEARDAFDAEDESALCALAELAVIAIQNGKQADTLARANAIAMMGAWGADVTQDINTEVGNIRREIYILNHTSGMSVEAKDHLKGIDRAAARLAAYELPESSIKVATVPMPSFRVAHLDAIVQSEIDNYRAIYPKIEWQGRLGCGRAEVSIHEQWLQRVLHHLLRNAGNALSSRPGGHIMVSTSLRDAVAEVQIRDNGKGVRPEIRNLIFRQPIGHDTGPEGRGLLLARFILERHNGKIWLDWSEPEQGACFAFQLPLAPESSLKR